MRARAHAGGVAGVVDVNAGDCRKTILAMASAGGRTSADMGKMLNLSLSIRKYSPKVEMLRTLEASEEAPGTTPAATSNRHAPK